MELTDLSPIQTEIVKALEKIGEKSRFSEAILAKKIRENAKIDGKKNAGISLNDLEKALSYFEDNNLAFYSVIMNSANDLLIEKSVESSPLSEEARSRRLRSEKSRVIFTNSDLNSKKSSKKPQKSKRERFFEDDE